MVPKPSDKPLVTSVDGHRLPGFWAQDNERWVKGFMRARHTLNLRHGMLAQVPMICRAEKCPLVDACYLRPRERIVGARCPIEAATVIELYERYAQQAGIDLDRVDMKTQAVDLSLIHELVELDIRIMRGLQKLAINADFVQEVVTEVGPQGEAYTEAKLRPEVEYVSQLRKERHRILDLLLATRKSRKDVNLGKDPSSMAAWLMMKAREIEAESSTAPSIDAQVADAGKEIS